MNLTAHPKLLVAAVAAVLAVAALTVGLLAAPAAEQTGERQGGVADRDLSATVDEVSRRVADDGPGEMLDEGWVDEQGHVLLVLSAGPDADSATIGVEVSERFAVVREELYGGIVKIAVAPEDAAAAVAAAAADPTVAHTALNQTVQAEGVNDPRYNATSQFGIVGQHLNAPWTGQFSAFDVDLTVAVLDTGLDTSVELPSARVVPGFNSFESQTTTADFDGHGTSSAIVVAAETDNAVGGAGVCPTCRIMPVRVFAEGPPDDQGRPTALATEATVASGITWAVDNGAEVISMSLSGGANTAVMRTAVENAAAQGVVLVASAGNQLHGGSVTAPRYPAAYPEVIAVAASNPQGGLYSWSYRGPWVETSASGVNWSGRVVDGQLQGHPYVGTSSAAPLVAGAVASFTVFADDGDPQTVAEALPASVKPSSQVGGGDVDGLAWAGVLNGQPVIRVFVGQVPAGAACLQNDSCRGTPAAGATVTFQRASQQFSRVVGSDGYTTVPMPSAWDGFSLDVAASAPGLQAPAASATQDAVALTAGEVADATLTLTFGGPPTTDPEPEPEPEPEPLVCSNGCAEQDPDGACVACHPASSEPSGTGQGEAIGRIVADSIDLDVALVYGTSDAALRSGPGWMEGSAWLGEPGNAVVSGHRTTYGSPFNRVDELEPGDRIEIRMPGSPDAVYEVRDLFITSPQEVGVTAGTRGARLTLTSCHPKGYAHERIIVQAELVDGPFVSEALEWGDWPPYPRRQPL